MLDERSTDQGPGGIAQESQPPRWRRLLSSVPSVYWALLVLLVILGILSHKSVEPRALLNIVRQGAPVGLVALGQTLVISTGCWDLSVGSTVALVDVVAAEVIAGRDAWVIPVTVLVLAIGAFIGLINGLLVTRFRVNAFIATLGTNLLVVGAALVYSGGHPGGGIPSSMLYWGNGFVLGVLPSSAVLWLAIAALIALLLNRGVLGHLFVGVGANQKAAHLAGVHVDRVRTAAFIICGMLCAAGGWVLVAYVGTPTLDIGTDFMLGSFAATVIGGTALSGGRATILGTVGGTLFLMVLYNMLTVLSLPMSGRRMLEGTTILVAVALGSRGSK